MTGRTLQNEFFNRVLAQNLIRSALILKNPRDLAIQISISIFLDHIRARFDVFLDFSTKSDHSGSKVSRGGAENRHPQSR